MRCIVIPLGVSLALAMAACTKTSPSTDVRTAQETTGQDLKLTYSGFMQDGPEDQLLDGVCGTNATRNVLECDVHNGLMSWYVTGITFQVMRTGDEERHYYRERVSIPPLRTAHVAIRLGMQLPPDDYIKVRGRPGRQSRTHWNWLIVKASGISAD